jgi:hypothetical protein
MLTAAPIRVMPPEVMAPDTERVCETDATSDGRNGTGRFAALRSIA